MFLKSSMKISSSIWLVIVIGTSLSARAAERYSSWKKEQIIEIAVKYVADTKAEFARRAAAVKEETGEGVDAIYWFCDLDDKVEKEAIAALAGLLKKHQAKLFIHTLKRAPPKALRDVAENSGGAVIRKWIR
jgi:hypothetical protein